MATIAAIKIETALRKTSSFEECRTGAYFLLLFIRFVFILLIFQNCYFLCPFSGLGVKKKPFPRKRMAQNIFQFNPHLPLQPANNRCCGNNGNMDTSSIHNQWNKSSKVFIQTETMFNLYSKHYLIVNLPFFNFHICLNQDLLDFRINRIKKHCPNFDSFDLLQHLTFWFLLRSNESVSSNLRYRKPASFNG